VWRRREIWDRARKCSVLFVQGFVDARLYVRILSNQQHPVQLVVAGKAHPADEPGRASGQGLDSIRLAAELRNRVVFLSDYDMLLAEYWSAASISGSTHLAVGRHAETSGM
jgi:glucan phosphorylase